MAITKHRNKDGSISHQVRVHLKGQGKVYVGSFRLLRDAQRAEREATSLFDKLSPGGLLTFSEWADIWLTESTVGATTITTYRSSLKRVKPVLGDTPLSAITRTDLQSLIAHLAQHGGYTPATVRQTLQVVVNALGAATDEGRIQPLDARKLRYPKDRESRVRILTREQAQLLTDNAGDMELFVTLGLSTGCRLGELLGIERQDITNGVLHVQRQYIRGKSRPLKTVAADRFITLPPALWARVKSLPHGALLVHNDARMQQWYVYERWAEMCEAAGLSGFTPHDLRHTYASVLIGNGADIKTVQRMMGHATSAITLDTYSHLLPDAGLRAAGIIGEWLS